MDSLSEEDLVSKWRASLTEKERKLHDLAAVKLKKELHADAQDGDNGSYFAEKSHSFRKWLKAQSSA